MTKHQGLSDRVVAIPYSQEKRGVAVIASMFDISIKHTGPVQAPGCDGQGTPRLHFAELINAYKALLAMTRRFTHLDAVLRRTSTLLV